MSSVQLASAISSRHKGVTWDKTTRKWMAQIKHGGKNEFLGRFAAEEEAKARYDARCLELGRDPGGVTRSRKADTTKKKTTTKQSEKKQSSAVRERSGRPSHSLAT
jgi:hypothetical protein